jgi:hypothetical protein
MKRNREFAFGRFDNRDEDYQSNRFEKSDTRLNFSSRSARRTSADYEPYSIFDSSMDFQPCDEPREGTKIVTDYDEESEVVPLNFNFWRERSHIIDVELSNFLLSLLIKGKQCEQTDGTKRLSSVLNFAESIFLSPLAIAPNSVFFIAAHQINPISLGKYFSSLPFLSTCTNVPLRHTEAPILDDSWRYMDMKPMSSSILWRNTKCISSKFLNCVSLKSLFSSYLLRFQVNQELYSTYFHHLIFIFYRGLT